MIDLNETQAAIRAGYSEKTAYSIGEENLKKPVIADAIAERMKERYECFKNTTIKAAIEKKSTKTKGGARED